MRSKATKCPVPGCEHYPARRRSIDPWRIIGWAIVLCGSLTVCAMIASVIALAVGR